MLLFCILHISFSNFSELTFSVEQKYVAYKHLDNKMFPGVTYIAAWSMVHLPIALVETAMFSWCCTPWWASGDDHRATGCSSFSTSSSPTSPWRRFSASSRSSRQTWRRRRPSPVRSSPSSSSSPDSSSPRARWARSSSSTTSPLRILAAVAVPERVFVRLVRRQSRHQPGGADRVPRGENNTADATTPVATLCANGAFDCTTMGKAIMAQIQIDDDTRYYWGGARFAPGSSCCDVFRRDARSRRSAS